MRGGLRVLLLLLHLGIVVVGLSDLVAKLAVARLIGLAEVIGRGARSRARLLVLV